MVEVLSEKIMKSGYDYAEIRFDEGSASSVSIAGKEVEHTGTNNFSGGCVRVYNNGRWGFVSFNDKDLVDKAIRKAGEQCEGKPGEKTAISAGPQVKDYVKAGYEINPSSITLEEKFRLCSSYNEILNKSNIETTSVRYRDIDMKNHFVNTGGSVITQEKINSGIMMAAVARDGSNVQQAYRSFGENAGYEIVKGKEINAEDTVKDALDLLKAPKIQGGKYDVIMDQRLSGVFAHEAFGHLSESDFLCRNSDFQKKMVPGTRFGPELLSIVDDGTLLDARGGFKYDDEGFPSQKTYLIKNGVLEGRLHSRETASVMGESCTGNARAMNYRFQPIVRMSCTYIESGESSFEDLIEGIDRGVYAIGMLGGNTDLEMFTFSAEKAFLIEKGKLKGLVRDVILTGNVFETMKNIDGAASDFELHGGMGGCGKAGQSPLPVSDGGPHIRARDVLIG